MKFCLPTSVLSGSLALSSSPGRCSFVSEAFVLVLCSSSMVSLGSSVSVRVSSSSDEWRESLQKRSSGNFTTSLGGIGPCLLLFIRGGTVCHPDCESSISSSAAASLSLSGSTAAGLFCTFPAYVAGFGSFSSPAARHCFCFVVIVVFVVLFVGQLFDQWSLPLQ